MNKQLTQEELLFQAIGSLNSFASFLRTQRKNAFVFKVNKKEKNQWINQVDTLSGRLQQEYFRLSDN
jgi:hypothetical protein